MSDDLGSRKTVHGHERPSFVNICSGRSQMNNEGTDPAKLLHLFFLHATVCWKITQQN